MARYFGTIAPSSFGAVTSPFVAAGIWLPVDATERKVDVSVPRFTGGGNTPGFYLVTEQLASIKDNGANADLGGGPADAQLRYQIYASAPSAPGARLEADVTNYQFTITLAPGSGITLSHVQYDDNVVLEFLWTETLK